MSLIFICINNFNMPLLKVTLKISKINNVIPVHIDFDWISHILYICKEYTLPKAALFYLFQLLIFAIYIFGIFMPWKYPQENYKP